MKGAAASILTYDWVVVTSARTVDPLMDALAFSGVSVRAIGASPLRVCAVGPATAEALRGAGLPVHLVPERFHAGGVVAALGASGSATRLRVLLPRAEEGSETIPRELSKAGFLVDVVAAYETAPDPDESNRLAVDVAGAEIDLLTFTASSAVRSFASGWGARGPFPVGVGVVAIGPATAETLDAVGMPPQGIADPHTLEGLVAAAERWAASKNQGA